MGDQAIYSCCNSLYVLFSQDEREEMIGMKAKVLSLLFLSFLISPLLDSLGVKSTGNKCQK